MSHVICTLVWCVVFVLRAQASPGEEPEHEFISVKNPQTLGSDRLPAKRIPIGVAGDYKPCIARRRSLEIAEGLTEPT